jgi:type II secretory pathway pseudopilin PulG
VTRAFTLLEVLVAGTLGLLLLGLLTSLLVPGLRSTTRGTVQAELAQQGMVVTSCLAADLQSTAVSGVATDAAAGYARLSAHPVVGLLGSGNLEWARRLVVYSWGGPNTTLLRQEWSAPGPPALAVTSSAPFRPTRGQLASLASSGRPGRTLATGVERFQLTLAGSAARLTLALVRPAGGPGQPAQRLELTRTVSLRNRG